MNCGVSWFLQAPYLMGLLGQVQVGTRWQGYRQGSQLQEGSLHINKHMVHQDLTIQLGAGTCVVTMSTNPTERMCRQQSTMSNH